MEVLWTEELATGNSIIDAQHKSIFNAANHMLEACQNGKGKDAVAETIHFLERYVVEHFTAEEKMQRDSAYPGFMEHKTEHDGFVERISALKKQFDSEGGSISVVVNTNHAMVKWLTGHIKRSDRAFSEYLRKYS